PFRLLLLELLATLGSQPVIARAAVGLGDLPFRGEPAAPLEPVQRGIERSVLHLNGVVRTGADCQSDAVPVARAPLQRLQDHQVERPLHQFDAIHWQTVYHRASTIVQACAGEFSGWAGRSRPTAS